MRRLAATAWLCLLTLPIAAAAQPAATCMPDPLAGRTLYLRGTFNSWNASETQKFTWACNRWELVTRIEGEQAFKLGDDGWSADADFGARPGSDRLEPKGPEIKHRFTGTTRFTVDAAGPAPTLRIESCPAEAPFGATVLFLRGTLNNWAALDEFALQYSCDAYYLNLKASGRHEFKVADAAWKDATTFSDNGANHAFAFDGEHTVRLAFDAGRPRLSIGPKTFADPSARAVSDPVALSLRFDSRDATHKRPFGAVTPGTAIAFEVHALPGVEALTLVIETRRLEGNQEVLDYTESARVPMTRHVVADGRERWSAQHRFAAIGIYGYWFEARIGGKSFVLQNNADAVFWTREKGSGGLAAVADAPAGSVVPRTIRRFRQTVYAADFKVPAWAPDIVYYYVFPERFRNGDPANDPKPGRDRYAEGSVERHANWNEKPFKPGSGDGSDATFNNDFFGGDLAGLIQKLDYIKALGANTVYMTPVFKAASNHKYDTADFKQIDPAFGRDADFSRLTREAARRGIRVIPDTSLNHTGSDSLYFDRYARFGGHGAFVGGQPNPASPYFDWYSFDPSQTEPDKQYKGWVGVSTLPELDKASRNYREFAFGAADSVTRLWLSRGAAGWRMDVAPWVPDDFWRAWRKAVKSAKPDALTIAETWFDSSKYFLGDMFDSTMNYIFRNTVLEYAAGGKAQALYANIELMREAYPPQAFFAQMNLLSTHDQARSLHVLGWHDGTRDAATIERAKQRFKLAVLFQMTFPGAPTVYYGDEVGLTGGDDPYNRGTYPWADLGGQPDTAMLATFKRLIALRKQHPVLRRGSIDAPAFIDDQVIVLVRRLGRQIAVVATNNSDAPRSVRLKLPVAVPGGQLRDALTGVRVDATAAAADLVFTVPPMWGTVLISP